MENKNVYILSLEGAAIWEHIQKDKRINFDYCGMLPNSFHLDKLKEMGIKTFDSKRYNKTMTNDVINVKFKWSFDNIKDLPDNEEYNTLNIVLRVLKSERKLLNKIKYNIKLKINKEYKKKIVDKEQLKKDLNNIINDIKMKNNQIEDITERIESIENTYYIESKELRKLLYKYGFTITYKNKDKTITKIQYAVMSRSSAKSRTGQVLFVNKKKIDKIIKWMRMGMNLEGRNDIDFPSLLSYESLVSSSIEEKIKIDTKNILLVDDVKSIFPIPVNVVEKDANGKLISVPRDDFQMENDIFDGEGILDNSVMKEAGREQFGMILLRQHMFKCCAFNGDIQLFLKDYAIEHGIDFNTWELHDMFNNPIFAKDVLFILTPASIKSLKFNKVKGSKPKMWEHWKYIVEKEDNLFGIVKSEHPSKRGFDEENKIINQTSYQMLNSMPISFLDMQKLSSFEINYIEQLKNNSDKFVEYLRENANDQNTNQMLADLYERNNDAEGITIFKVKRKSDINQYKDHVKKGKIRLSGDYLTIFQNGKELLYHAIGELPVKKNPKNDLVLQYKDWKNEMVLNDNEVYTTLHPFDNEYVGFRNPHTSPSNVLVVNNKNNDFIKNYFNLTDNIIYANAINFPINRILSGQDVDSDTLVLFDSDTLLSNALKCYVKSPESNYKVCVNGIKRDPNSYTVVVEDMAKIDNILAESQKNIGSVVNLGQLYMSNFHDLKNKGCKDTEKLDELMQGVDVATILSEVAIDSAKRLYDVKIKEQIKYLSESKILSNKKPLFFKYVSDNKEIDKKIKEFQCPMDYLYKIINDIEDAKDISTVDLEKIMLPVDTRKIKLDKVKKIINLINKMINECKHIESKYNSNDEDEKKEKYNRLDDVRNNYMNRIKNYKIYTETMSAIIRNIWRDKIHCKYKADLLNTLYQIDKDEFLKVFKESK